MAGIRINRTVVVDDGEVDVRFTRSGGPGGQHVNTSSTKVELRWNLDRSSALSEEQKHRVRARLRSRLTGGGDLVLHASEHRSQTRNREAVVARFAALLADALRVRPPRRATIPTVAARRRRVESKRRRAQTKALRRRPVQE